MGRGAGKGMLRSTPRWVRDAEGQGCPSWADPRQRSRDVQCFQTGRSTQVWGEPPHPHEAEQLCPNPAMSSAPAPSATTLG